jgi:cob(I)alamin adenosyltransferase
MKIYTKLGDEGETSLFDGSRAMKCSQRIKLLGQIDELNSFIGLLISKVSDKYHLELRLI